MYFHYCQSIRTNTCRCKYYKENVIYFRLDGIFIETGHTLKL